MAKKPSGSSRSGYRSPGSPGSPGGPKGRPPYVAVDPITDEWTKKKNIKSEKAKFKSNLKKFGLEEAKKRIYLTRDERAEFEPILQGLIEDHLAKE